MSEQRLGRESTRINANRRVQSARLLHCYLSKGVMSIDDPVSALQALNESEERQRSPVQDYAKYFLDIVKLFAPPGTKLPIGGISAALGWLNGQHGIGPNSSMFLQMS